MFARRDADGIVTRADYSLSEGGIIDVALLLAGVERRLVGRIERGIFPVAGWQVRIGEERHAECDKVGFAVRDRRLSGAGIVAAVDDQRAIERSRRIGVTRTVPAGAAIGPAIASETCR